MLPASCRQTNRRKLHWQDAGSTIVTSGSKDPERKPHWRNAGVVFERISTEDAKKDRLAYQQRLASFFFVLAFIGELAFAFIGEIEVAALQHLLSAGRFRRLVRAILFPIGCWSDVSHDFYFVRLQRASCSYAISFCQSRR